MDSVASFREWLEREAWDVDWIRRPLAPSPAVFKAPSWQRHFPSHPGSPEPSGDSDELLAYAISGAAETIEREVPIRKVVGTDHPSYIGKSFHQMALRGGAKRANPGWILEYMDDYRAGDLGKRIWLGQINNEDAFYLRGDGNNRLCLAAVYAAARGEHDATVAANVERIRVDRSWHEGLVRLRQLVWRANWIASRFGILRRWRIHLPPVAQLLSEPRQPMIIVSRDRQGFYRPQRIVFSDSNEACEWVRFDTSRTSTIRERIRRRFR